MIFKRLKLQYKVFKALYCLVKNIEENDMSTSFSNRDKEVAVLRQETQTAQEGTPDTAQAEPTLVNERTDRTRNDGSEIAFILDGGFYINPEPNLNFIFDWILKRQFKRKVRSFEERKGNKAKNDILNFAEDYDI